MGIVPSLALIAVGAILKWGVTADAQGIDVGTVGVILLIIGLFGLLLSLVLWSSWWGPGYFGQRTVYTGSAAPATPARRGWGGYGRRRVDVVEEEGPVGGPAPGEPLP
jgi:hypothetical protein